MHITPELQSVNMLNEYKWFLVSVTLWQMGFIIQKYLELAVCLGNALLVFKYVQPVLEMKYLLFSV